MDYNVPTNVGMDFSLQKIPTSKSYGALKIIVAMKLIALLVLLSFQVTASVYSQRISLSVNNSSLRDVLQQVRRQSKYSFFIETDNLQGSKPLNLNLRSTSIPDALDKIFEDQPFTYTIQNNVIIVMRKRLNNLSAVDFLTFDNGGPDSLKVVRIQGKVLDEKGQPLIGVSVRVKGGGTGTVTSPDGSYTLKTNAAATLVFSYIGYLTREIKAEQGQVDVILKQLNTALDQVQVIAYGTTTKRYSTGNVSTVTAEAIETQPVSNPLLALSGRVAGLYIRQTSGISAGNVDLNIQGTNSLRQGTAPFFVIDGVPYSPQNLSPSISIGSFNGTGSTLAYINPNDIASISVLKDADATAIYGSRAANGAILITTKKGKTGNTRVDLNLQTGWEKVPKQIPTLNTPDYIALRKQAKKNDNIAISPTDYDINGKWDSTQTTNWQKELIGGTARYSNLQASVSGGSATTQFLVSGGYIRETTVYPGSFGDTKINVHTNLNHVSPNQKFRFYLSSTYLQDNNNLSTTDLTNLALSLPPNAPSLYMSDGSPNWGYIPSDGSYSFSNNPVGYLLRTYKSNSNNLIGNTEIGYTFIPGLEFKTSLGYNRIQSQETNVVPQASYNPGIIDNRRSATNSNKSITTWIAEPQITYKKNLPIGYFEALVGGTLQEIKNYVFAVTGSGTSSDALLSNIQSAPIQNVGNFLQSTYHYNALFGRLTYRRSEKYILTLAGRRDGSSRFGPANRFANFYSIGGSWVFGDEKFISNNLKFLSFGKLRMSYGTTGNDQIGDYQYLTLYSNVITSIPYQQTVGLQPSGHSNPYLQWELTKKLNFGLDIGILNNRILITSNYYINNSNNQLLSYPLGYTTGFYNINKNIGATIQNRGIELQIDGNPIRSKKLTWSVSINFTSNQNKLKEFDGLQNTTLKNVYVIGYPVGIAKAFPFLGVNSQTGLYEYLSFDGKATSSPNYSTDLTKIIKLPPQWFGGLSNTITYKRVTLDFLFQFVKQMGRSNRMTLLGNSPGVKQNVPAIIAGNYWTTPGQNAIYQKPSTINNPSFNALSSSDAGYEDASFLKLRNASISYTLPAAWIKKVKASNCKVFIQGQNLLTFTKYFGLDPETQGITFLPPLRTITIGVNMGL